MPDDSKINVHASAAPDEWGHRRWRCALHGVTGRPDDDSLTRHQDDEHGGSQIAISIVEATDAD